MSGIIETALASAVAKKGLKVISESITKEVAGSEEKAPAEVKLQLSAAGYTVTVFSDGTFKRSHAYSENYVNWTQWKEKPLTDLVEVDVLGLPMTTGLVVLTGRSDTGKSPVARAIKADHILFGEPLPGYLTRMSDLMYSLYKALESDSKFVVVDSLKDLFNRAGGALSTGGIPRELMSDMSNWGTIFAEFGKTLVVVVNISDDRDEIIQNVIEMIKSNTTGAIVMESSASGMYINRAIGLGMRKRGKFTTKWEGRGKFGEFIKSENYDAPRDDEGDASTMNIDVKVTDTMLSKALRLAARTRA